MEREELETGCQKGKGIKCGRKCEKKEEEGGCGMCCRGTAVVPCPLFSPSVHPGAAA